MRKSLLCRTLGTAGLAFWAAIAATTVAALAIQFRIHVANEWQQHVSLPTAPVPGSGDRVVVFAPHSDDETLGCGGMLALAARNGAKVRVVLITNGDGYRIAVARAFKSLNASPNKCVEFAYRRQRETLKALSELGVPAERVTFLGYPDRGIAPLWDRYWGDEELYKSHATKWDHSPYANSFTPSAPYCGESLLRDIQAILVAEKPTDVYLPHPCDNHSDHYATSCFVMAAIEQLDSEGWDFARKIQAHTYLVHRGDWPCPRGDRLNEPLSPPYALAKSRTKWQSLQLPKDVAKAKRQAIRTYKTQTAIERGFLMSFARENEVFGSMPVRKIEAAPKSGIEVDGEPADWTGIQPAVLNPVADSVVANINRGGDVRSIYLCSDDDYLYVRADYVRSVSKRITYTINLRGLNDTSSSRFTIRIKPGSSCSPAGTMWAYSGNVMEVAVPLEEASADDDLFVQVYTRLVRLTVDNTGWHGFEFDKPGSEETRASAESGR